MSIEQKSKTKKKARKKVTEKQWKFSQIQNVIVKPQQEENRSNDTKTVFEIPDSILAKQLMMTAINNYNRSNGGFNYVGPTPKVIPVILSSSRSSRLCQSLRNARSTDLADPNFENSSSADSNLSSTDKLPLKPPSAKRMKLDNLPQTLTKNTINTPSTSQLLVDSSISDETSEFNDQPYESALDRVVNAWANLVGAKIKEFDENTREFLMNQIDNYLFRSKLKEIKRKKEEKKKEESLFNENSDCFPSTSSYSPVQPLYVDVKTASDLNSKDEQFELTLSPNSVVDIKEEKIDDDDDEL